MKSFYFKTDFHNIIQLLRMFHFLLPIPQSNYINIIIRFFDEIMRIGMFSCILHYYLHLFFDLVVIIIFQMIMLKVFSGSI